MPLPSWLAGFNRGVTNRVTRPFAGRLPGFGVVIHKGRRSGRLYRTPVNVFRSGDRFVIALTYGRDRDWVRNVLAAEGCEIETRGRAVRLAHPRILKEEGLALVPSAVRPILKALGVIAFMELRPSGRASGGAGAGTR